MPRKLARYIAGHKVQTVQGAGWASSKNGNLLRLAEANFDVLVTMDRHLADQQNMARFDIAVIVIAAVSNNIDDLLPFVPELLEAIPKAEPGAPLVLGQQTLR